MPRPKQLVRSNGFPSYQQMAALTCILWELQLPSAQAIQPHLKCQGFPDSQV